MSDNSIHNAAAVLVRNSHLELMFQAMLSEKMQLVLSHSPVGDSEQLKADLAAYHAIREFRDFIEQHAKQVRDA